MISAQFLQRLGDSPMNPRSAGVSQVLVQRVLNEGMGKAVLAQVGQLAHQCNRSGALEDVQQSLLIGQSGLGQEVEVEIASDNCCHREHAAGILPQTKDPGPNHLAHGIGQSRSI